MRAPQQSQRSSYRYTRAPANGESAGHASGAVPASARLEFGQRPLESLVPRVLLPSRSQPQAISKVGRSKANRNADRPWFVAAPAIRRGGWGRPTWNKSVTLPAVEFHVVPLLVPLAAAAEEHTACVIRTSAVVEAAPQFRRFGGSGHLGNAAGTASVSSSALSPGETLSRQETARSTCGS